MTVGAPMSIALQPNAIPFALTSARRIPLALIDSAKAEIDKMVKQGIIVPQSNVTPWCHPLVVVPKKTAGEARICAVSYTHLTLPTILRV